jgi:hypothetical protein
MSSLLNMGLISRHREARERSLSSDFAERV